jgi:hypothetical protein
MGEVDDPPLSDKERQWLSIRQSHREWNRAQARAREAYEQQQLRGRFITHTP